jgi:predicted nucleic acid-binding protein
VTAASLRRAIPPDALIILDTSVVLSYLNGTDRIAPAAAIVVDELVAAGINRAAVSTISVTESLVRPFKVGPAAVAVVETFLRHFANLEIVEMGYDVARTAAEVRATTGLKTPDATFVATALLRGGLIVANDGGWQTAVTTIGRGLKLVHLDAFLPL